MRVPSLPRALCWAKQRPPKMSTSLSPDPGTHSATQQRKTVCNGTKVAQQATLRCEVTVEHPGGPNVIKRGPPALRRPPMLRGTSKSACAVPWVGPTACHSGPISEHLYHCGLNDFPPNGLCSLICARLRARVSVSKQTAGCANTATAAMCGPRSLPAPPGCWAAGRSLGPSFTLSRPRWGPQAPSPDSRTHLIEGEGVQSRAPHGVTMAPWCPPPGCIGPGTAAGMTGGLPAGQCPWGTHQTPPAPGPALTSCPHPQRLDVLGAGPRPHPDAGSQQPCSFCLCPPAHGQPGRCPPGRKQWGWQLLERPQWDSLL